MRPRADAPLTPWSEWQRLKIHHRGVQWKQDAVICMMIYTSLLYNDTTPIHCTPLPLPPPCNEYIYIYIYCYLCIYIYMHIYIYICRRPCSWGRPSCIIVSNVISIIIVIIVIIIIIIIMIAISSNISLHIYIYIYIYRYIHTYILSIHNKHIYIYIYDSLSLYTLEKNIPLAALASRRPTQGRATSFARQGTSRR